MAQFRTREPPPAMSPPPKVGAAPSSTALVVAGNDASPLDPAVQRDLSVARADYEAALEALHQQRVMLELLEDMMREKLPAEGLKADAAVQTDVTGSTGGLPLVELVQKRLEVVRWKTRRKSAAMWYQQQIAVMHSELTALRNAVEDVIPRGVAMVGLAREGVAKDHSNPPQ